MRTERTRKLRDKPKPYVSKPGPKTPRKAPATSAISTKDRQQKNLTVNDWLTVFAFVDAHPRISQASVCNHFHSLADGASVLQARPGPKDGVSARHFGADGPIILRTETVPKAFRVLG